MNSEKNKENSLKETKAALNDIRRYCMKSYGWTIKEVDEAPYHRMMELIIEKEKEEKQHNEVMSGADFISRL